MTDAEKAVLNYCNKVIKRLGGTPRRKIRPGVLVSHGECPIARTIRAGSPTGKTCMVSVVVSVTAVSVAATCGAVTLVERHPQVVRDFIIAFDKGKWPEYETI